jgi:lantibiotic leader peptide-processing serine protease
MSRSMGRRMLLVAAVAVQSLALAAPASAEKYIVLYKSSSVPVDASRTIHDAGGRVVASYDEIGVVVADSDVASFRDAVMRDNRIEGAEGTSRYGTRLPPVQTESHDEQPPELPNAPAGQDPLFPLQWDMRQIDTPRAHAITGGSPAVITGIIDTGVDKDHPDLVQNIDFSKSASCESGSPDQNPAAWDDRNGHGTHTAGTTAAAQNGFGITGVAPHTKIAAIKSSTDEGFFFPEMVVCSFMWAGSQHLDVTNNSYFADPFLYNCRNDKVQHAIWKAEQRAIRYAQQQGVTVVAAIGNDSDDRAHPTVDLISPDFPPGSEVERRVTNACVVVPVEVSGVIGVTATGNQPQGDRPDPDPEPTGRPQRKSFYSAYGVGVADLAAPGGDSLQITAEAPNGRVLSTWPAEIPCTRMVQDPPPPPEPTAVYCYLQGTSMASPHVAGVAALVVSRFGDLDNPQNGKMRPGAVQQYVEKTADPQPCPTAEEMAFYAPFPRPDGEPQECQGGEGYNSWYGHGEANAFKAVTHDTSNR